MNDFLINPLGLLGLLGIPIIILIYLLKSKYVSKPVSSTFIWKRSLKYVKNRLPLSFVFSLLLILQLLTVILASFAIARPQIKPFITKDTVIILDSSASMLTKNQDGKTRYELAIEQIEKDAALAGENNKITVITAGSVANSKIVRSADKMDVIGAISDAECGLGVADIEGALKLANNVQNINPDAKIYLYTDKAYLDADGVEIKDFSNDDDINVAITNLTDTYMGGKYSFNATVNLYVPEPEDINQVVSKDAVISIYIDGSKVNTQTVTLTSGKNLITFTHKETLTANNAQFYQISPLSEYRSCKIVIEKITEVDDAEAEITDGLLEDNTRFVYATEGKKVKILVVSTYVKMIKNTDGQEEADPANSTFLVTLLRNIGYSLSNKTDIKDSLSKVNNGGAIEGYDLYIFDGVMPEVLPNDGAVWFMNPPSDPIGTGIQLSVSPEEAVKGSPFYMIPAVDTGTEAYKVLTKNIGKRNIAIGKFRPISIVGATNYQEIFTCNNSPIVVAGREANVRVVCMSFDIHDSNLPMLIDFPLIVYNMLNYSLPDAVAQRAFDVGETVKFSAPVGATGLKFQFHHDDTGEVNDLNVLDAADTEFILDKLGNYAVLVTYENGYEQTIMLPTAVPADESDITVIGDSIVAMDITTTLEPPEEDPMEIWPYIVMVLLAILIIEWGVYYRDEF